MHLRNMGHLVWLHLTSSWCVLFSGTDELFATCAKKDIRVWHTLSNRELLRITVPNMTCHSIDFMRDGKSIISGIVGTLRSGLLLCLWLGILSFSLYPGLYQWMTWNSLPLSSQPSLLLF